MNYKNAKIIFPESLLLEIQKYVDGEIIYIPSKEEKKQKWGNKNGARQKYIIRNNEIKNLYITGLTINELANKYFLTVDSIRKIIKNLSA